MTKFYSTFDIWLRVVCGVLIGFIIGYFLNQGIHFLYTEGYQYDKAIKEFKTEVLHINEAWEVNVYPDAKFDVVTSGIEKDVPLTPAKEK